MQLDRNKSPDGKGRFSIIDNRTGQIVHNGDPVDDFFVMKLKDIHAEPALRAYAASVRAHDPEFADQVEALADRAGRNHPHCKQPD